MTDMTQTQRLPRMIVTGEFSAGKTKLINGLVGQQVLPSNVTSTSLPPVWLIYGKDVSFRIDLDGNVHEVSGLDEVNVHDTLVYVTAVESDTLRHMDIIDTPGNSDPNIPSACWERMVGHADMMIWCTGATQAWRQSEKSTVRDLPQPLRDQGMLLITQADRIAEERQQEKLKRRVSRDASQFLSEIRMASLIDDDQVSTLRDEIISLADAADGRPGDLLSPVEAARHKTLEDVADAPDLVEDDENEAVDAPAQDTSILAALDRVAVSVESAPEAPEDPLPVSEAPVEADATDENRKVGLELLNVVSKLDKKRSVKRKRSPAMTSLVEALGEQLSAEDLEGEAPVEAEDPIPSVAEPAPEPEPVPQPEPEQTSSRVLWDVLIAERQDKDACVDDFIACVDQLFMPEGSKPADEDLVAAMKSVASNMLASKANTDASGQPVTASTGA